MDLTFEIGEIVEKGDVVVETGVLVVHGVASGRYFGVYRRQPDGTLKVAVDVALFD
jgi:ketosteroid isomerase-like protein